MTFTSCFRHPPDRPPLTTKDDPHVFRGFQADGCVSPLEHCVRGNIGEAPGLRGIRQLKTFAQQVPMGFPLNYTTELQPEPGQRFDQEHASRSAIGNSFHVPCLLLVRTLLMHPQPAAALPGFPCAPTLQEQFAWTAGLSVGTTWHTEWEPPPEAVQSSGDILVMAFSL